MAKNIEIKARIQSIDSQLTKVRAVADAGPTELFQADTFFACPNGRLKLRAFSSAVGELIFYQRENRSGPKESFYSIVPTATPDLLRAMLSRAYGEIGHVRKKRIVYMAGRTRIHLDRVEGLGDFLELEVVLAEGESAESGTQEANDLLEKLGIKPENLIEGAYLDLQPKS